MHPNQIADCSAVLSFMFAGKATLTLKSVKTGKHVTLKINQASNSHHRHFVKVLTGPDNDTHYTYMATIDNKGLPRITAGSKVGSDHPAFLALTFLLQFISDKQRLPTTMEVWHEGKCGRCGRTLTRPDSLARGIGPECAGLI